MGPGVRHSELKIVMISLIKRKSCHDQQLQATPSSVDMKAITESTKYEGGITLI